MREKVIAGGAVPLGQARKRLQPLWVSGYDGTVWQQTEEMECLMFELSSCIFVIFAKESGKTLKHKGKQEVAVEVTP